MTGILKLSHRLVQNVTSRKLFTGNLRIRYLFYLIALPKKFYKNVTISQTLVKDEEYPVFEVLLDHRKLKTTGGNQFYLPNKTLAFAVAHEWDSQCDTIKRYSMHLTTLCNRILDSQYIVEKLTLINGIMHYTETDTICYKSHEPDDLMALQSVVWDPVLHWIETNYDIKPIVTNTLTDLTSLQTSDKNKLIEILKSYNYWGLTGIHSCIEDLKSTFLTLAALDGFLSASKAVELSNIEMLFQANRWGEVRSYHDIETVELNSRVSAALFLVMLSHHRHDVKIKRDQYAN